MRSDHLQSIRINLEPPLYLLRTLVALPKPMSKAGEGEGAARAADRFENRRLELVQTVDDLPDRIILGDEFRSGTCAGGASDQNSGDEQQNPSHGGFISGER